MSPANVTEFNGLLSPLHTSGVHCHALAACPGPVPALHALLRLASAAGKANNFRCCLSSAGAQAAVSPAAPKLAKFLATRLSRRSPPRQPRPANALDPPSPADIGLAFSSEATIPSSTATVSPRSTDPLQYQLLIFLGIKSGFRDVRGPMGCTLSASGR
jgi:hypothetical protein